MEGPRAVQEKEFESLRALTDAVFRPGMPEQYPQLFNAENQENLRVCVEAGRCVSHVGMTQRKASLLGCLIQVCCIGAVCTYKEFRGQGLASRCFDDAVEKAFHDGVDLMIVSGDRHLYRSCGCLRVGSDTAFALTEADLDGIEAARLPIVTVEKMQEDELPPVRDCYQQEPVRFLRPLDDYHYARQSGYVMNHPSDFLLVRDQDAFQGYAVLQRPGEEGRGSLVEFAGSRRAILAALPEIFRAYGLTELRWQVSRQDTRFRLLCERAGLHATPTAASGTVKLIHFTQLMERLRPLWEERLGRREAASLAFRQDGEEYRFRYGEAEFVTDRDTATRLLFGTVDGAEKQALEGQGRLAEVLQVMLPIPTLWYGINYV